MIKKKKIGYIKGLGAQVPSCGHMALTSSDIVWCKELEAQIETQKDHFESIIQAHE